LTSIFIPSDIPFVNALTEDVADASVARNTLLLQVCIQLRPCGLSVFPFVVLEIVRHRFFGLGLHRLGVFILVSITDYLGNQIVGHFRGRYGFFNIVLGNYSIALDFCRQKPCNHVTVLRCGWVMFLFHLLRNLFRCCHSVGTEGRPCCLSTSVCPSVRGSDISSYHHDIGCLSHKPGSAGR